MERGFKYRIYPNESQRDQIARTFGCCRFVYNRALDVKKTAYSETGKSIATNDLIKMIPAWKRDPETSWLAQVDSMALQQSIRDLDRAYKNFFRRVREGGKPGFPKFKSRRHARQGRPVLPVEQDLLGLRAQARCPAAVGAVVGLPCVRCAPRSRRQRGEKHTDGGETHPLQHGRYRGARGNRGGYNRLNARGEDVRP